MTDNRQPSQPAIVPPSPRRPVRARGLVDPASFRGALARFATGVTVLTAGGEHSHGMTANAFSSVSLRPPLVLCCVARTARMHRAIVSQQRFAVSVLGADQERLARYFADRGRPPGAAQFDRVDWVLGPYSDAPLLTGSLAWLECELAEAHDGGDHTIFLGSVVSCGAGVDRSGLVFYAGGFHRVEAVSPAGQQPAG